MLPTPPEAAQLISAHLPPLPSEHCPLALAHGRTLRQALTADRPMPPFDRVTMDGFAVRSADLAPPAARLRIVGFQGAGMMVQQLGAPGLALEVATGAILPRGADAVVPYEEAVRTEDHMALAPGATCLAGQNRHAQGSDCAAGTVLVAAGQRLSGREIAIAATVGCAQLTVAARPTVAIVATGDELVDVSTEHVAPHQIRKSNDHAIRAALLQSGLVASAERFHLRDHRDEIDTALRRILAEFDVVVLTGGISKGKLDYVPEALARLGVTQHLRGVAQRPGKPLWFGTTPRRTPIFALPGNPVSTYTCLHRYVLPALRQMAGDATSPATETVVLAATVKFPRPLAYLLPVRVTAEPDGRRLAHPAPSNTSGDLGGLIGTDGFVELPAARDAFPAGTIAAFWRWT